MKKKIKQGKDIDAKVAMEGIKAIEVAKELLIKRFVDAKDQKYSCRYGFEIKLRSSGGRPPIEISLDHLDRQNIADLMRSGDLADEPLFLYELAHLPFVKPYRVHIASEGLDTYIVDRLYIELDEYFNVFDRGQWAGYNLRSFFKANELEQMYCETEPYYTQLRESSKTERGHRAK